jgi:hypothetical protein
VVGQAARQSALTLPGETDPATGKPQSFLLIKLIEPAPMPQEQPPQQTAQAKPLDRDDLNTIIEALEYRSDAIAGGTDFDEVARLKSIGATLEKLRAIEAQPQRPEHEQYERLLRATAALRYPAEERTPELETRIERTITRKVGEFTQECEMRGRAKAYEASLWREVERRHPALTDKQRRDYEERIAALVADHKAALARHQPQPARGHEQGRGIET